MRNYFFRSVFIRSVAEFASTNVRPLFVGLAVVMPVLGHATWHLYRRIVTA